MSLVLGTSLSLGDNLRDSRIFVPAGIQDLPLGFSMVYCCSYCILCSLRSHCLYFEQLSMLLPKVKKIQSEYSETVSLELCCGLGRKGSRLWIPRECCLLLTASLTTLGPCARVKVFLNACNTLPTARLWCWWQLGIRVIHVINLLIMMLKEKLIVEVP